MKIVNSSLPECLKIKPTGLKIPPMPDDQTKIKRQQVETTWFTKRAGPPNKNSLIERQPPYFRHTKNPGYENNIFRPKLMQNTMNTHQKRAGKTTKTNIQSNMMKRNWEIAQAKT